MKTSITHRHEALFLAFELLERGFMKKLSSIKDFVLLAILLSLLTVKAYTKSHMQIALMLHKCDSA